MAEDVRGLSVVEATLIAGGLAILGTLLGVVIERLLRLIGRLRGEASGWEATFTVARDGYGGYPEVEPERAQTSVERVEYRFAIDLFNGKEVPTGLRSTSVVLVDDGKSFKSVPQDLGTARMGEFLPGHPIPVGAGIDDLEVVNLPPRQIVRKDLQGNLGREAAVALASGKWSKVEFVGELPERPFFGLLGSKTFRYVVTKRS